MACCCSNVFFINSSHRVCVDTISESRDWKKLNSFENRKKLMIIFQGGRMNQKFHFFREERPEKLNSILNQFFFGCTHVCLSDDMKCHKNLWNDIRLFHIFIYILQTVWYERNVHQNLIFLRECQSAAFVELKIERVTTEIFFLSLFLLLVQLHTDYIVERRTSFDIQLLQIDFLMKAIERH